MTELTSTSGIIAIAGAVVALIALVLAGAALVRQRSILRAQRAVLGNTGDQDLVAHAEHIQRGLGDLRDWTEEVLARLDERVGRNEQTLQGSIAHRALIRYDAYGEMSGRQSSSVALLDAHHSGVVISSILHRDQARVYVKQVHRGESELDLSPEELEAIRTALQPTRE